ncbi:MAG: Histidine--tRNA ligase [Elusimicrobia bacterium ADurb.Bin231]|nr:MAG: Histidine--tRNA ligase [Elusimicrobia bacterium ADurb.Bin231]
MKYQTLKGMRNIVGSKAEKFDFIESVAKSVFKKYNYNLLKIPVLEYASLFLRSIGETTDIVDKEMYVFEDKGKRHIALRPEATAGIVKTFVEENLAQKFSSQKFYYIGQMFRQERPQSGRYREFTQIDCEYFGNPSVYADIEIIMLAKEILDFSGVNDTKILINSIGCAECRPAFVNKLRGLIAGSLSGLCEDCRVRYQRNPLRVLDCKIDGEKFSDVKLELCDSCRKDFEQLQLRLSEYKIDFTVSGSLVRGLDYYTKTVFEIVSSALGSQNAVCAGGRYDTLVKELGGFSTPAVGFAIGVDRVVEIAESLSFSSATSPVACFVVASGDEKITGSGFDILSKLRAAGLTADGGYFNKSLKSQMRHAGSLNAIYTLIIGADEFAAGKIILRNMRTKEQREILFSEAVQEIQKIFKK